MSEARNAHNFEFAKRVQTFLKEEGLYSGAIDGFAGPATTGAWDRFMARRGPAARIADSPAQTPVPEPVRAPLNETSEANLRGVRRELVELVREAAKYHRFDVIEGLRTVERQRQLVAQGASKTMNSRHITGHAVDLWPIDPATGRRVAHPDPKERERLLWAALRAIAATMKRLSAERNVPIVWGGDWGWDAPHFELDRRKYP